MRTLRFDIDGKEVIAKKYGTSWAVACEGQWLGTLTVPKVKPRPHWKYFVREDKFGSSYALTIENGCAQLLQRPDPNADAKVQSL